MANWVKCTVREDRTGADRAHYINLDKVVSVTPGNNTTTTTIMYAPGQNADPEAGMLSVKETPEQILGNEVVRNA